MRKQTWTPPDTLVSEVEEVPPQKGAHRFVIRHVLGTDGSGLRVDARGPRGEVETTVYGIPQPASCIGAVFYRN